ncbi:MAG TPA: hypothetical protein VKZ77_06810 [Bacillaceae bacterium]|nr:hypothetical protein [Bacillaceae bacterium]
MDTIIIILLAASIILFIISFLQPDKVKSLEKEVEQLNMTILQEQYLVKKRLKVLEEELLMEQNGVDIISRNSLEPNEILKNLVIALHKQGKNVHQISKQSSLPLETVKTIIHQTFGRV